MTQEALQNMVVKVYPSTYTNGENTFKDLQKAFSEGWIFKTAILSFLDDKGNHVYDYILEK